MARETLDRRILHLLEQIQMMDAMVGSATTNAIKALMEHDVTSATRLYTEDAKINAIRFQLEEDCMITIATQQPIMATDLRFVASILEVVGELERMGDYAKGIAKIAVLLGEDPQLAPNPELTHMAEITVGMLHRAVQAFIKHDAETARRIPAEDDIVDDYYRQIYRMLASLTTREPQVIDEANHLMWAAHNLERMADRVTNICERTMYTVTGKFEEVDVTDDELREE